MKKVNHNPEAEEELWGGEKPKLNIALVKLLNIMYSLAAKSYYYKLLLIIHNHSIILIIISKDLFI